MLAALLGHEHRGQPAPKRVPEFQETVWTHASDVGNDDAAPMELCEDLLVDPGVVIRLATVDNGQLVSQLRLDNGSTTVSKWFCTSPQSGWSGFRRRTIKAFGRSRASSSSMSSPIRSKTGFVDRKLIRLIQP